MHSPRELENVYARRFAGAGRYRQAVWRELCVFFSRWVPASGAVLDLGCGHCEFINEIDCARKYGMDLNPETRRRAAADVTILSQDCTAPWGLPDSSLEAVFTSNFLEHLPTKAAIQITLRHAWKAIVPGGRLIAMGPNIRTVPGAYWDFFDHYVPLTERSMEEVLSTCGFEMEWSCARFLPYTMSGATQYPLWLLRAYLALPIAWRLFGRQFVVVAVKR